jgi:Zn-dependent protease
LFELSVAQIFIAFLVLLFSLTVHEAAHAWAANRCGDATARMLGRMTLNPLPHIDVLGTVVFPLMAIVAHVPVIGWAKPVPVDPLRLRHYRRDSMAVAAAGPASNLLLAVAAALVIRMIPPGIVAAAGPGVAAPIVELLGRLMEINVLLAIFNLLPIPPLDGAGVLAGLVPPRVAAALEAVRPYGFLVLYGLMLTGWLGVLITRPYSMVMSWLL